VKRRAWGTATILSETRARLRGAKCEFTAEVEEAIERSLQDYAPARKFFTVEALAQHLKDPIEGCRKLVRNGCSGPKVVR